MSKERRKFNALGDMNNIMTLQPRAEGSNSFWQSSCGDVNVIILLYRILGACGKALLVKVASLFTSDLPYILFPTRVDISRYLYGQASRSYKRRTQSTYTTYSSPLVKTTPPDLIRISSFEFVGCGTTTLMSRVRRLQRTHSHPLNLSARSWRGAGFRIWSSYFCLI